MKRTSNAMAGAAGPAGLSPLRFVSAFFAVVLICSHAHATTWNIHPDGSGDAPTITGGIAAAAAGDTILLAPGTYTGAGNRDIVLTNLVLRSSGGAAVTVIDCEGAGRGFYLTGYSRLEGVTVTNGVADKGGAIYSVSMNFVRKCILTGNTATSGGAVYIESIYNAPTFTDNIISDNTASSGGGVYAYNTIYMEVKLLRNTIQNNAATNMGGGIYFSGVDMSVEDNTITGNSAASGGGIYSFNVGSPTVIRGNTISDNIAGTGGGIWNDAVGDINDNRILRNSGGGILLSHNGSCYDNLIAQNVGSGVMCDGSVGLIGNNTIVSNTGDGIAFVMLARGSLERNIIAFNGQLGMSCDGGSSPRVSCCDIYGNSAANQICGRDEGGNIQDNPLFCGAPEDSAYYLAANSPCTATNSPCGALIGAFSVGCSDIEIPPPPPLNPYIECAYDMVLPPVQYSQIALSGFAINNVDPIKSIRFDYAVGVSGKGYLFGNGSYSQLITGSTPLLSPGQSFVPPVDGLLLLDITLADVVLISFDITSSDLSVGASCQTSVSFDIIVPVLIRSFDATAMAERVALKWDISADETVDGFEILRRTIGETEPTILGSGALIAPSDRHLDDKTVVPGKSYEYTLVVVSEGNRIQSSPVAVNIDPLAAELRQNYPNPFNPSTTIRYSVGRESDVSVAIYDGTGKLVRTLISGVQSAGSYALTWNGRDNYGNEVGTGIYFYRLLLPDYSATRKMVLLR